MMIYKKSYKQFHKNASALIFIWVRARGHIFRTHFHSSETQRVMRLPAAVRWQVESSSYDPDCSHFKRSKDILDLM